MILKEQLYNLLVRRKPIIKSKYEGYVDGLKRKRARSKIKTWLTLIAMNFSYYVLRDKGLKRFNREHEKIPYIGGSESSLSFKETPESFAEKLEKFDVISFDIFDTLVLRPFSSPRDLFYLVGEKLNYLDYPSIRSLNEGMARDIKHKAEGTYEVNIEEIYRLIEKKTGIPAEKGIAAEFATELELCYANPYMKRVFDILLSKKKKVIITSDMYLIKAQIEAILAKCGYKGYERLFLSNDLMKSKHDGTLYRLIKKQFGDDKAYAHIGDNEFSDEKMAKANGFTAFMYGNVNGWGYSFRADRMSAIIGSAYAGTVNARLHSGLKEYSMPYEYGYVCGGIFALGYCNYIHKLSKRLNIDKVLFLARDGYILKRIYEQMFPSDKTEYVYWSRYSAAKLGVDYYKSDFVRRFVYHKVGSGRTIEDIIDETGAAELKKAVKLSLGEPLVESNAEKLAEIFYDNWDIIENAYREENNAAKRYFSEILGGCKNALAVDIGWAGSGAVIMADIVKRKYEIPCEIIAVIAGTNGADMAEPNMSESYLQSGRMYSYCFSQSDNYELFKHHSPARGHNIYMEMLLGAPMAQFRGFETDGNSFKLSFFPEENENYAAIEEIHLGTADFVTDYLERFKACPYMLNISGSDAYAPFYTATKCDCAYLKKVLGQLTFSADVSGGNKKIEKFV